MPPEEEWSQDADTDEQQNPEGEADDSTEDEEEEEDEATVALRAKIEADVRASFQQSVQAEVEKAKAELSRKYDRFTRSLSDLGLARTEDGHVVAADPNRLRQAALQYGAAPAEQAPADVFLDPFASSEELTEQAKQVARQQLSPLEQKIQRLEGLLTRQTVGAAIGSVEPYLEARGYRGVTQHPEFAARMAQNLRAAGDTDFSDPGLLRKAALLVADDLMPELPTADQEPVRQPSGAMLAAANRNALAQTRPANGTPAPRRVPRPEAAEAVADLPGWFGSAEEWEALSDPTGDAYRKYQQRIARKRSK